MPIPIAMIAGLAAPYLKQLVGTFMDAGCNLAASAITGSGKVAKEYIEEKTGISLEDPSKLSGDDMAEIAKLEANPEGAIKLKELSLAFLAEENRHEEATDQNWEDRLNILNKADETGNTTRPKVALRMANVVSFEIIVLVSAISIAIGTGKTETIDAIKECWEVIAILIGIPMGLLNSYFGKRTKEKKARVDLVSQLPTKGFIKDIIGEFKK